MANFKIGGFSGGTSAGSAAIDAKKAAMEAAKQKSLGSGAASANVIMRWSAPGDCADRIRIVFDDSDSMSGQIENAKAGVVEFLKNCIPNQTAVAVHYMNTRSWSTSLRSDLPMLGQDILESCLASGSTPFFNTLKNALQATPKLTRLVAFTDGAPTDQLSSEDNEEAAIPEFYSHQQDTWSASADIIIKIAHAVGGEACIPIDTVYFGTGASYEHRQMSLLRYLSKQTGGYFLHFDPAKVNFRTAFKYLASSYRLMLSSGSFRAELESGKKV